MSLSKLAAQLAGLNNSTSTANKHVGSIMVATSKRHEDAIGRGFHHSVQLGHDVIVANPKFKPSILYESAKAAADVPLATLWENCQAALKELAAVYPPLKAYHTVCQDLLLQRRSGGVKSKTNLTNLLTILSTLYGQQDDNCWHVLEYLVRRYNVHVTAADWLLVSLLPHAQTFPKIFFRVLQLVNIVAVPQSCWMWLRPYARTSSTMEIVVVPRHVIANNIMAHPALLQQVCQLTQSIAQLEKSTTNVGLSHVLSWSATVLVQGLAQLQTVEPASSHYESVLRVILPVGCQACSSRDETWTAWGHIVASAVAETMELAPAVQKVLCQHIIQGALAQAKDNNSHDNTIIKMVGDALVAIWSVCMPRNSLDKDLWNATLEDDNDNSDNKGNLNQCLYMPFVNVLDGLLFSNPTVATLLPQIWSYLYHDRQMDIGIPMVANCMVLAVLHRCNKPATRQILLAWMQEPRLQALWTGGGDSNEGNDKDGSLVEDLAEWLVATFLQTHHDNEDNANNDEKSQQRQTNRLLLYQALLQELRRLDPKACEQGMARAMEDCLDRHDQYTIEVGNNKNNTINNNSNMTKQLVVLLEGVLPTTKKSADNESTTGASSSTWLPPRVALEHADPSVRLQAIEQLLDEYQSNTAKNDDGDDDVVMKDTTSATESLQQALCRRMASDDNPQVVLGAAKALIKVVSSCSRELLDNVQAQNDVLATLYQWTTFKSLSLAGKKGETATATRDGRDRDSAPTTRLSIIIHCLQILGHVRCPLNNVEETEGPPQRQRVLEGLTSHLEHWNADVAQAASAAILSVLGESTNKTKSPSRKSKSKAPLDRAKQLLLELKDFGPKLMVLEDNEESKREENYKDTILSLRRRSLWVMLGIVADSIGSKHNKDKNDKVKHSSQVGVDICLFLLSSKMEKDTWSKNQDRVQHLKDSWSKCATHVSPETVPLVLVRLASIAGETLYEAIAKDFIKVATESVKDEGGHALSVYSVIMEAATRATASVNAVKRLLKLAGDYVEEEANQGRKHPAVWHCIVPTLALLQHADKTIRIATLFLISQCSDSLSASSSKGQCAKWKPLTFICKEVMKNKSSVILGGTDVLPTCLSLVCKSSRDVRECLLQLCVAATVSCGQDAQTSEAIIGSPWLPLGQASGHIGSAVAVLRDMELAGEKAFPLKSRWDGFGASVLTKILDSDSQYNVMPEPLLQVCDCVVGMLKGVCVSDASALETIIISSGPGVKGRRQRSYSVGKMAGVDYVDEYPEAMSEAISRIFDHAAANESAASLALCKALLSKVLGKESWADGIFKKLSTNSKRKIAGKLLAFLADSTMQVSISYFFGLPLDALDIIFLRSECGSGETGLSSMSILADYVRCNGHEVMASEGASALVADLFETVSTLSSSFTDGNDEVEFVRQSLLLATQELLSERTTEAGNLDISEKTVKGWVALLLSLNGNKATASTSFRPLSSQRSMNVALSLLTTLCANFPKPVVTSLIPALKTHIETMETSADEEKVAENSRGTFDSIVPVYLKYASHASLSFLNLLEAFVSSARSISSEKKRAGLYKSLIASIDESDLTPKDDPSMGAVVACYFASELQAMGPKTEISIAELQNLTEFAVQVMEDATDSAQVSSILLLLHYADSLLLLLQDLDGSTQPGASSTSFDASDTFLPDCNAILQMIQSKSGSKKSTKKLGPEKRNTLMNFALVCLLAANDVLLLEQVRRFIRRSDRNNTTLSLRLWQDLLVVQSTASQTASTSDVGGDYWETTIRVTGESLEHIQSVMPLPTFLASATSLIREGETDELRAGAIRLVADRAPEVHTGTPEASLFLDMLPLLTGFLKCPVKQPSTKESVSILQQSALVAIEHIARAHFSSRSTAALTFLPALQGCAELIVQICGSGKGENVDIGQLDDPSRKLLCSTALCIATLVRVTAPKCLAVLPSFMNQLVASLSSVNDFVSSTKDDHGEILGDARTTQVCLLRCLTSISESLPQFVYPYLKKLLTHSSLPSGALWNNSIDPTVRFAAEALEKSLSVHVPARVLLPVVSKALTSLQDPIEFDVLLRMLKRSIDASPGEELVGHLRPLLTAVTTTYDFKGEHSDRIALIVAANEAVLALVMKLSEVHLRRLYAALRDWRGSLDAGNSDKWAWRRYAFWKVSALLGKELRTIFLPCLSSVISDAVGELTFAVSKLCTPKKSEKSQDGKKKRRLVEESEGELSTESMLSIQPLLSCLEFAFRADGQDGGKWIRADEGERYRALLEPLGRLLQARVPVDFPHEGAGNNTDSPFHAFIGGQDSASSGSGTVIACLTAMAGAAGNEQLWKPLNYAVLDACGNSGRSEVRKAGLRCLLSLMTSLGEEYMVLLPECLPVLSELLEDNDEEVAGLAQDCITLGEELLGESLEDSLR